MGLVPLIRTFTDFESDKIDYAPFIAFLNTGLLTKQELQELNKKENLVDICQDMLTSLEGKMSYLMNDYFTVMKNYKNFSDFWQANKFSYENLGSEFITLTGSEIISKYLNKDYTFKQDVIDNFKQLLPDSNYYDLDKTINVDPNKPFGYLYYQDKEADTQGFIGRPMKKLYTESLKLQKFEEFFRTDAIEKTTLPIQTKDLIFITKLYDVIDLYMPKNVFKLDIELTKADKNMLIMAAILVNIDTEKFEKDVDNIIEEARLRGIYQHLQWCDNLVAFIFSVSNLLKRHPLKDLKDEAFINVFIKVCQEYEIHFDDCKLLANHYSKGDVSGDSKTIFDEIQKKIPTLIKGNIKEETD